MIDTKTVANSVLQMDKQMRESLFINNGEPQAKKLWENTYIKKQLDRRKNGETFTVSDHIRGMIYSMLTSGAAWNRLEPHIDIETGQIPIIDDIFYQYDVTALQSADPTELCEKVKALKLGTQYLKNQTEALVKENIGKLLFIKEKYGSVDKFYQSLADKNDNLKTLVRELATAGKPYKFAQLGEALTAEYLKNVGYDIGKPDRHIRRILGSEYLGYSKHKDVPPYEAIDIIADIAKSLNKPAAEVDYILWAYCANGFGEVCTKGKPKCMELCVAEPFCNYKDKQED